jgi:[citrate (pro-3S)-lyase] ligase
MNIKEVILENERNEQIEFLHSYHLDYEWDIDYAILLYDKDEVVGTASLSNNVMKCFLVREDYKNMNLTNKMFHHLEEILNEKGINHFFVFTSPENEKIFISLNMHKIVETMNTVLFEGGKNITNVLMDLKKEYKVSDNKKACVIINANPMTNGHMYLIETASKENEEVLVFVVSEDISSFPFEDRFDIIKKATQHLENVIVLPTLSYLVSKLSFPKYFLKEDQLINEEQTLVDVLVYKKYYRKIFTINKRYLGEEPYSFNTNKYNETLVNYLNGHIEIVKRKEHLNKPISASLVRQLIKSEHLNRIREYVPQATMNYFETEKGKKTIKRIQSSELGRH